MTCPIGAEEVKAEEMPGMWEEQWSRVQRWYEAFTQTEAGRRHDRTSDDYLDEVHAFFQNCYHLKDWLKNDPASKVLAKDVEDMLAKSTSLSLCADLANGSKHLTLKTTRTGDLGTKFGPKHFALGLTAGQTPVISVSLEVLSGGSTWDAYDIATQCVSEWETYLKGIGLLS
ncbi:MAG TPA: hypothetical protein DCK98_14555 [Chloroflexi bacterium]|jgi:hypothetical protein|nr:hypothetical protein [Chloroflexota bacterium]HAL28712.1 hypothetical protein [Chloroflexota bacterium]